MKKFIFPATLVAMMGVGAYFGHANATPTEGLSDLELANAEALANDDYTDLGYDKACESGGGIFCAISAFQWYEDSKPYPNENDAD